MDENPTMQRITGDLTPEQAKALIQADQQRRIKAVNAAVQSALEEHKCELRAVPVILEDGRIVANIVIVAL